MNVDVFLARATSALNKPVKYKSPGSAPPLKATTWPDDPTQIDCSGFVAWCLRISRKVDHPLYAKVNGGWFETTAVHADGMKSTGYFTRTKTARPGALLVYPDYKGSDNKMHDGHMGIVIDVDSTKKGIEAVTGIIHCSVGNDKNGSAIQKTSSGIWQSKNHPSIIVWREDLEE